MILFGFTIGVALNYKYGQSLISQKPDTPISTNTSGLKLHLARIGLTLLSLLPCLAIWGQYILLKKKNDYSILMCIYEYLSMSVVYLLAGIILMRLTPQLWKRFNVHLQRDFVINYADSPNRKRLYYSP